MFLVKMKKKAFGFKQRPHLYMYVAYNDTQNDVKNQTLSILNIKNYVAWHHFGDEKVGPQKTTWLQFEVSVPISAILFYQWHSILSSSCCVLTGHQK